MSVVKDEQIASCILALLREREAEASACPSDVARAIAAGEQGWRTLMPRVRAVARTLAQAGKLRVTQKDRELDPSDEWHGPVRLRLPVG